MCSNDPVEAPRRVESLKLVLENRMDHTRQELGISLGHLAMHSHLATNLATGVTTAIVHLPHLLEGTRRRPKNEANLEKIFKNQFIPPIVFRSVGYLRIS